MGSSPRRVWKYGSMVCVVCLEPIEPPRKTYCGEDCQHEATRVKRRLAYAKKVAYTLDEMDEEREMILCYEYLENPMPFDQVVSDVAWGLRYDEYGRPFITVDEVSPGIVVTAEVGDNNWDELLK